MKFRTELTPQKHPNPLQLQNKILLAGSCFAGHIGEKLQRFRFSSMVNPFGVIFNPVSLCNNLKKCFEGDLPDESLYVQSQEVWYHYQLHTDFSGEEVSDLTQMIENTWKNTAAFLGNTNYVVLTFGTAWVYRLVENNSLVANCHKVPSKRFKKELLSVEEIKTAFIQFKEVLPADVQYILTVSPVRHLKDTLALNSVSKATLRLACHQLAETFSEVHYFPAYELLLDDLRDYRFFNADMLHPTPQAVDYVWEKFLNSCIAEDAQLFTQKFEKLLLQTEHRPHHPETEANQQFLAKLLQQLKSIKEVNVDDLIAEVEGKLKR